MTLPPFPQLELLDRDTMYAALTGIGIALAVALVGSVLRRTARGRVRRFAERTSTQWDDLIVAVIADLRTWFIVVVALDLGWRTFGHLPRIQGVLDFLFAAGGAIQIVITSRLVVDFIVDTMIEARREANGQPDPALKSASGIIRFLAMVSLSALMILVLLSNVGIEVTPLITGLGIGGVAVALAAQSILGDLFGSLTILFDRPFLVGDFIIVGDKMGTVEHIGVKTTRLRALSGEQLIFSNAHLLAEKIQNYQRMYERRIVQVIGVVYETPLTVVRAIPDILRSCVEAQTSTRFDRAHFRGFGAYSLDFEFVYYVTSPDYNAYMDVQQRINLCIFEKFEHEGIEFAYPTQVELHRRYGAASRAGSTA